ENDSLEDRGAKPRGFSSNDSQGEGREYRGERREGYRRDDREGGERRDFRGDGGGYGRPARDFGGERREGFGGPRGGERRDFRAEGGEDRPRRDFGSDRREGFGGQRGGRDFGGRSGGGRGFQGGRPPREGGFGSRQGDGPRSPREGGFGSGPRAPRDGNWKPRSADDKKDDFIYGIHPVMEALESGKTIDKIWIQEGHLQGQLAELLQEFSNRKLTWKQVPHQKLNSLVRGNHQGVVVALAAIPFANLDDVVAAAFEKGEDPFILVLDGVTDVRNFGAIARTAACAGVHALLLPERGSAPLGGDSVRTSAGALFKIPVCRTQSLYHSLKSLKNSGLSLVGATEKGSQDLYEVELSGPLAVVMGSEETGLSTDVWKLCDRHARIPLSAGGVESLNVSVACGVLLYEAVRQKRTP
ncbi:MAG: 23S rRNA (guanosine(2251)-2'-O)-methyltransferase RlmB, partial [Bacteroidetes bacterium]|nr:23S rRNA (guanosine(2251)-2'-O)-methyltransferase RlmB [Bacteroidota bacterium]